MSPLRAAFADDEPLARERLARLLTDLGCEVVGEFPNGQELLKWLRAGNRPDALFLDIQMPGISGLEVLAELSDPPPTIFVTAFSDHAVRAFDLAAVDYLVKPIFADRLARSLERIQTRQVAPLEQSTARNLNMTLTERIPVKAGEGVVFLDFRRITHFEVVENVVWAWSGGRRFRCQWTAIREVEEAFPKAGLVRIQRHLLLRPEAVVGWKSLMGGRGSVRVAEGIDLEVSRTAAPGLREILKLNRG